MAGTLLPPAASSSFVSAERRTISGERRIELPRSGTIPVPRSDGVPSNVIDLFGDGEIDDIVEGALSEAAVPAEASRDRDHGEGRNAAIAPRPPEDETADAAIPIAVGTVLIPAFRTPVVEVPPQLVAPPAASAARAPKSEVFAAAVLFVALLGIAVFATALVAAVMFG